MVSNEAEKISIRGDKNKQQRNIGICVIAPLLSLATLKLPNYA